ncbi:hypothetical protein JZ751_002731, partial [Albula glossodonta]
MDLLLSQNFMVKVDDLQNVKQDQVFWRLLHSTTHILNNFSQDVVWKRAAATIPYSQTDFRWLFCNLGPLGPSGGKQKGRRRGNLKALPCLPSPPPDPCCLGVREIPANDLVPLPPRSLLPAAQSSIIFPTQRGALQDTGNNGDQSSCMDECLPKKPERTMPQLIPQQCRIKSRVRSGLKGFSTSCIREELTCQDFCRDQDLLEEVQLVNEAKATLPTGHRQVFLTQCPTSGMAEDKQVHFLLKSEDKSNARLSFSCLPAVHTNEPKESKLTMNSVTLQCTATPLHPKVGLDPDTGSHVHQTKSSLQQLLLTGMSPSGYSRTAAGSSQNMATRSLRHFGPSCRPDPELSLLCYAVESWIRSRRIMQYGVVRNIHPVLQELQPLLLCALGDQHVQVQIAAAVCQYAMGSPNPHTREILLSTLRQGVDTDSWVAAQCLAMEGETSLLVIQRLLTQLFGSEIQRDKEQATTLLASISCETALVRSLLAEELNCANWRNRVLACKTIGRLKSPVNKDLVNKLTQLMWKDWHSEARQAAARALEELGQGRQLHNELRVKLEDAPSLLRVEALALLAQLRIMTAKLLPSFLGCFKDSFMAVRRQACETASVLFTKSEMIVDRLIQLMVDDPVCEVKVAAITALGKIGCLTPTLQKLLLLAMHHEEEPEVRIAACKAIRILGVNTPELQHLLQQRLLLEMHPEVHRHIEDLMKSYGFSLQADKNIAHKIKQQVQELCTKRIITEKVLLLEKLIESQEQQRRFLGHSPPPDILPPALCQLLQDHYR